MRNRNNNNKERRTRDESHLYALRQCLNNISDPAGLWQIEGGEVLQQDKHVANYSSVKRVNCGTLEQKRLCCG